ncbi:MAG: sulfurtransferase [Acidimicrobiia bacterium]|nr:sulfurtransferase [Acidimicrobiia bacterium]
MSPLVTVEELAAMYARHGVAVCDVRWYLADPDRGRLEYDRAHLPGAVFVDLHTQLAGGPGGGRHPLPIVDDFTLLLGRLGIGPESTVAVYDNMGGAIAARLWWMLRSIGHERVAVLDGGYSAWVAADQPVSAEIPETDSRSYPPVGSWTGTVTADGVAESVAAGGMLIDARAAERYRGETEPIDPRAGHIPGARNLPHLDNLSADGTHRSPTDLAERFDGLGDQPIVYCGSGVTACHDLLAMEIAGVTGGLLYPGSWSEWSSDAGRPVDVSPGH